MNIVRKDIDAVNAIVTVQIAKEDYNEKVEKTLKEYRKKANIPGFRPGQTPISLVKKMYGKAILAEEVNKIINDSLFGYIKEQNLDILGEPLPNETEQKEINFDTDETFEFVFDIALSPAFDLKLTAKDKIKYYDIAVTDELIDGQIKSYTGRFGSYEQTETVDAADVIKGHILQLDENGKVIENGIKVNDAVLSPAYMKNDEQKALFQGAKIGDVITFNPSVAYGNEAEISSLLKVSKEEAKDLAGNFSFEIANITRYKESEINQELFDKVFGEGVVKDETEFRAKVAEGVKETYAADSDYKFSLDTRDALVAKLDGVQFPEEFLKRWVLATNKNLTAETVEKDFELMLKDLKWYIIKNKLAKEFEVKVEKADMDAYARKVAKMQFAQYGMMNVPEDILDNYAQETLKNESQVRNMVEKVLEDKVVEVIKGKVKLDTKEITFEEFNKMFE